MLPDKIKLTDEYIDLIVKKRKEHDFTAYQLSEKLGKNKSWLPNIENHRTKNISKEDLFLIFKNFAKEEDLDTEKYIIKYLHPNTSIVLDNGTTVPCHFLQTKLELLSPLASPDEYFDQYSFYHEEIPYQKSLSSLEMALSDLAKVITKEYTNSDSDKREKISNTIDVMVDNFACEPNTTCSIYGQKIVNGTTLFFDKRPSEKQYFNDLSLLAQKYSLELELINAKAEVYSFFDIEGYSIGYRIANYELGDVQELSRILFCIEGYVNTVFRYVTKANEYELKLHTTAPVDYRKIYNGAIRFLNGFIAVSHLPYHLNFNVPTNDSTIDAVLKQHLELNNIIFNIRQLFYQRYHLSPE